MKAFVEWQCDCKCAGIVRVGPQCDREPFDWDFAFVIKRIGTRAIWKALLSPQWGWPWWLAWLRWLRPMPTVTLAHTRAAYVAVAREGLQLEECVEWDRLRTNPRRVVSQFSGEKGKITMARKDFPKASAHAVHTGRDGGNKIDQKAALDQIDGLVKAGRGGAAEIVHLETTELATAGKKRRVRGVIELELPA